MSRECPQGGGPSPGGRGRGGRGGRGGTPGRGGRGGTPRGGRGGRGFGTGGNQIDVGSKAGTGSNKKMTFD